MNQKEMEIIDEYLPASVKEAVVSHQTDKLVKQMTGLPDLTLDKIAGYFGGRMAARRLKWRPVFEGLDALKDL